MPDPKTYCSKDGGAYFWFRFEPRDGHIDILCTRHPPLNGRDPSVSKTHLYRSSGLICFVAGREPRTQAEAEQRAAEWAEYFLEYRRTGSAQ